MTKIPMKEKVLRFVESKGVAKFTEIQRFIFDNNKGTGSYDKDWVLDVVWLQPTIKFSRGRASVRFVKPCRGYYCSAFSGSNPWFMYGNDRLEKREDGKYIVLRNNPKERPEHRYWWAKTRNY